MICGADLSHSNSKYFFAFESITYRPSCQEPLRARAKLNP